MRTRDVQINVRLNPRELKRLDRQVARTQLSRSAYLRHLINGVSPKEAPPADYYAMMRQIHAIGNNLNQLAFRANCTGEMDACRIEAAVAELRTAIKGITEKVVIPEPLNQDEQNKTASNDLKDDLMKLIDTSMEWE